MDPAPENIQGTIVQKHTFTHEVNWGHVMLAVALLAIAYVGYQGIKTDRSNAGVDDDEDWG
jgi:hypothetical protein